MGHPELPVDNDASSQLALAANVLTILTALLQLTAVLAGLCGRLHLSKGETHRLIHAPDRD